MSDGKDFKFLNTSFNVHLWADTFIKICMA